jgi:hypothetical protein
MNARTILALASPLAVACSAHAANYTINWLSMAPTLPGNAPPFNANYTLPGVGNVQMAYTAHPDFSEARQILAPFQSQSVASGPDTYAWTNHEALARTNLGFSGVINSTWSVTYTFSATIPAQSLVLEFHGLGRRDPRPGENPLDGTTIATVNQNGTFLGETNPYGVGPTLFQSGAGTFNLRNALTGPGGNDPWWNTALAVVRIDDAVSSLTVTFNQTSGDGVGVNLGYIVPAPGPLALLGVAGLAIARRRR